MGGVVKVSMENKGAFSTPHFRSRFARLPRGER